MWHLNQDHYHPPCSQLSKAERDSASDCCNSEHRSPSPLAPSQKAVFPRGAELQCFSAAQGYLLLKLSEDERWELLSSTQLLRMKWRLCPGCGTLKILGPIYSWPTLSLGEGGSSPERQTEKTSGCMSSLPTSTKGSEILPGGRSRP